MRFGIAVFPGTWSDRDCAHEAVMLWHKDTGLRGADCVILPGGFAYGDYLRTGAVGSFARRGLSGICQRVGAKIARSTRKESG